MDQSIKKRNIIIAVLVFFVIIVGIGATFYINLKKETIVVADAIVTFIGDGYVIVEDENADEYSLKTDQRYQVGDRVSFTMKNIKKDTYPKEGTLKDIDTISKTVQFSIVDSKVEDEVNQGNDENTSVDSSNSSDIVPDNGHSENADVSTSETSQDDVVAYFEQLNSNLDSYQNDKSLGESIKSGFVTVVDFIFYGGTINGKTFSELSTTAKIRVLQLVFSIDKKIDQYFPGYKEQISATGSKIYTNVKAKALEYYLDITTKICSNDPYNCQSAKEGLADLKSSFSLTWDLIKDLSGIGLSKLKAWYEIWKEV